ncbi:MAG: sulfite exporter TauE/SafE family protein [Dehalococcoidia bacterium]|nr:sulfite exporter TauE/SafE family protein [Dehalococcoidia bacterium]
MELIVALFVVSWLAATISSVAGFGGALILLPIFSAVLGVKTAVPVLSVMQLIGNLSRVWFGRAQIAWTPVGLFLLGAAPAAILGSVVFASAPAAIVSRGIGVFLLVVVALRQTGRAKFMTSRPMFVAGGAITGVISGVAGSAGPLGAAFFLGLELPPAAYVASEAVTASVMHTLKLITYQRYAAIGLPELAYGLMFGAAMIGGSWTGKQLIDRLPPHVIRRFVEALLVISAIQLLLFS